MSAAPLLTAAVVPHAALLCHGHMLRAAAGAVRDAASALSARLGVSRRRPLISAVTPTWQRPELLAARCVPSVAAQTWVPAEHVIVSDGPDPVLAALPGLPLVHYLDRHVPCDSRGVHARAWGAGLARGELIAYLDDDNAWRPEHAERLAGALLESGADFAYSRAQCHAGPMTWEIGRTPPAFAQIDTSLIVHRRELLAVATWRPSPRPADWDLVDRWLAVGCTWVFVPRITLDYYARAAPAMTGLVT